MKRSENERLVDTLALSVAQFGAYASGIMVAGGADTLLVLAVFIFSGTAAKLLSLWARPWGGGE